MMRLAFGSISAESNFRYFKLLKKLEKMMNGAVSPRIQDAIPSETRDIL
jgi:hypothetical protein